MHRSCSLAIILLYYLLGSALAETSTPLFEHKVDDKLTVTNTPTQPDIETYPAIKFYGEVRYELPQTIDLSPHSTINKPALALSPRKNPLNLDPNLWGQARLIIELVDITDRNRPPHILASHSQLLDNSYAVRRLNKPIWRLCEKFNLLIDPAMLKIGHYYGLQARIRLGDILWFVSDHPTIITSSLFNNPSEKLYKAPLPSRLIEELRQPQRYHNGPYVVKIVPVKLPAKQLDESRSLIGELWHVDQLFGTDITEANQPSLIIYETQGLFKDQLAYQTLGNTGCNAYSTYAQLDEKQQRIIFGIPSLGFRRCFDKNMDIEDQFIDALAHTQSYRFDTLGRVFLMDSKGTLIARLRPDLSYQ